MSGSIDRREHVRWLLEEEVFCYLDGNRVQAATQDISAGGMFIRTSSELPLGSVVALVFEERSDGANVPVFLLGMTVRHQEQPVTGAGVQWMRAVTTSAPDALEKFLVARLKLVSPSIVREEFGPRKDLRSIYRFPIVPVKPKTGGWSRPAPVKRAPVVVKADQPKPSIAPVKMGFADTSKFLSGRKVDVVQDDGEVGERRAQSELPIHVRKQSDKKEEGPLSIVVRQGDTLPPTDIPAIIRYDGDNREATVTGLGLKCMRLELSNFPSAGSRKARVFFNLPSKGEVEPLECQCRILFIERDKDTGLFGLELEIERYHEKRTKGILWTYLKWLHFKTLGSHRNE